MSTLYRRSDSPYWWYSAKHEGRRMRLSTCMSQKHLAKKVQIRWDSRLAENDLSFLPGHINSKDILEYTDYYLGFISSRKTEKAVLTAQGSLKSFLAFLKKNDIKNLDEITVRVLNDYIDQDQCATKTKRNHMVEISLLLKQAVIEGLIRENPARLVTLPKIVKSNRHRNLSQEDLNVIFQNCGKWSLFLKFLYYTGLRAGDVAMLTYGNIDRNRGLIRRSARPHARRSRNCWRRKSTWTYG